MTSARPGHDDVETRGLIKKAESSPTTYTQGDDSCYRVYTDIDEGFYAILPPPPPNGAVREVGITRF